jgi:tousled-like kinase
LGKYIYTRSGQIVEEIWEEGGEITKQKEKLIEVGVKLLEIDKAKRKLNTSIRKTKNDKEGQDDLENEFNDMKDILDFKKAMLVKEEQDIKEMIDKLEKETIYYQIEHKRLNEEQNSKYCSIKSVERWAVLDNRYVILELLGKGGYSEVYKVIFVYTEIRAMT